MSPRFSGRKKVRARTKARRHPAATLRRGAPEVARQAAATPSSRFAVVGIGASAGGLAAVSALLTHLPRDIDPPSSSFNIWIPSTAA
jgi:chemotaxis response regulator CheB